MCPPVHLQKPSGGRRGPPLHRAISNKLYSFAADGLRQVLNQPILGCFLYQMQFSALTFSKSMLLSHLGQQHTYLFLLSSLFGAVAFRISALSKSILC